MADGSPTLYGKGRSAPDEVWGRVREDYLSGLPGIEVCRRHGVGLTAMRNRAAREGWRRTDQPWTRPTPWTPMTRGSCWNTRSTATWTGSSCATPEDDESRLC